MNAIAYCSLLANIEATARHCEISQAAAKQAVRDAQKAIKRTNKILAGI